MDEELKKAVDKSKAAAQQATTVEQQRDKPRSPQSYPVASLAPAGGAAIMATGRTQRRLSTRPGRSLAKRAGQST